jgi:DNA repair exonuclease SbcCD ATPase subunit
VASVANIMSDLEQNIKRINDKLQQLLKNYQLLQKENSRQSELIKQLKEAKEKDTQQITALQEKISILKAATGKMNEADKKEFEKNISQYIREIDKCIGILSE